MGRRRKGKIVDVLTRKYDIIARFQGGPNAGHTLEFEGKNMYYIPYHPAYFIKMYAMLWATV